MHNIRFAQDYKDNDRVRKSLSDLAHSTFGISFEDWYQKGYWKERLIPYSYLDGDRVIANVSVNIMDLIINGEIKQAVQIGTVMTHPDYRNKGLSSRLLTKVLDDYEHKCEYIYLFANESVLDFYPKFGFRPVQEQLFSLGNISEYRSGPAANKNVRKLDMQNEADRALMYQRSLERLPNSRRWGTANSEGILMFYGLNVFSEEIYYLEEENIIVIYKKEEDRIDLFDIISAKEFEIQDILTRIADKDVRKVVFHYTPDYKNTDLNNQAYDGGLFVRTRSSDISSFHNIKYPITSTT